MNKQVPVCMFNVYHSYAIAIGLFRVASKISYKLLLTAKMFYLLILSNPMSSYYVYTFVMVTILFLDFTVHFDSFITLKDGWLESTTEILVS